MSVKFTSKGLADGTDSTKELEFNVTGVTTGTTRTITVPDRNLTIGNAGDLTGTLPAIDGSQLTGLGGGLQAMQVFTSPGTWTKPVGITRVKVIVTGGGGGGGAHNADDAQGGGGAGATAIKIIDVTSVSSVTVTVGTGGAGGCGNVHNAGDPGTSSSFGAYCSAGGGSDPTSWGIGGVGGTATGGDINIFGGDGVCGNIDGQGNEEAGGTGGASYWGSGGRGGTAWGIVQPGRTYGSGGGGTHASTNNCGGTGANGVVLIEEYS